MTLRCRSVAACTIADCCLWRCEHDQRFYMEIAMTKFIPRVITADMAAQGYNNEGRGELLGYIAIPAHHEETCRYRISTGGDPDKTPHDSCTCRIGLWRIATPAQRVINEVRKTAKRKVKPTNKSAKKRKAVRK